MINAFAINGFTEREAQGNNSTRLLFGNYKTNPKVGRPGDWTIDKIGSVLFTLHEVDILHMCGIFGLTRPRWVSCILHMWDLC